MKRVYCIPTNRYIEPSLWSYIKEIDFVQKKYKETFPVVIIETTNGSVERKNRDFINKLSDKYDHIDIFHFTVEKQKKFFQDIFKDELAIYLDHFMSQKRDYGKAMNKIFLVSALLGAEVFHRRDSDTYLLSDFDPEYPHKYPLEIEMDYIGKRIDSLDEGIIGGKKINSNDLITVVGSNYYGEWNLDIKDFARKDFNLVYKLYEGLGFEQEFVKEICDESFRFDDPLVNEDDKYTLVTGVNDGKNPDCGNMAMYKLFEEYPVLSARNVLASDYFVMDLATAMKRPSLHHNRKVFHEYTSERFESQKKLTYWEGVLKFCDYFNLYNQIYDGAIVSEKSSREDISNIVAQFSSVNRESREERMRKIISDILYPFDENYQRIAIEIEQNIPQLIEELNKEYKLHSQMILDWPIVIDTASKLDWKAYL